MQALSIGLVISTSELWDEAQAALHQVPVRMAFEQAEIGDPLAFIEKIDRLMPEVIFLDVKVAGDQMADLIRQIRATRSSPDVIAVHGSSDPQTILSVMRAGAREYLYPPFQPNLEQALERISLERQERRDVNRPGGKSIGFVSAKGGCGATTLACHSAIQLARDTGQHALLMDLDLAAGIVRMLVKSKGRYSVMDALNNVQRLDPTYWKAIVANGIPNLEVLGGPAEVYPVEAANPDAIRQVVRFARTQYSWSVTDLGHGTSVALFAALEELDELYLVTTLEVPALYQTKRMVESLNKRGYQRSAIRLVVNRTPRRNELTSKEVETITGLPVFAGIPNDYTSINEAYSSGELLAANSALNRKIAALTTKIAGLDTGEPRKKGLFSVFG
ncbi:MAG TPA: response regulator [Bryobacteraceae bacterium]|jgi:pilus assembly protein CpaE|nr:response regulator [Bryobacteraceae bacterium]